MRVLSIPYFSSKIHYLANLQKLPGLIWFHEGIDQFETEWLTAIPTEEYEYLGNDQIIVRQFNGEEKVIKDNWVEFLCRQARDLEGDERFSFVGGLAGHLSYDLGLEVINIPSRFSDLEYPLAVVGHYDWALHLDHKNEIANLIIQDRCPTSIQQQLDTIKDKLFNSDNISVKPQYSLSPWHCGMSKAGYKTAFQKIKDYLLAGDCYQVNLTRQWTLLDPELDDLSLYLRLTKNMPAPFSMFHRSLSHTLLSVSPERFISIDNALVTTQPIKGTRKRGATEDEDSKLKDELANSNKDRAENLMIVDLLRNDLAKNAQPGSVKVNKLFEIQSFNNVHHLVSTISAEMKSGIHPIKLLHDAFPGGSITGAPKKRAMEIIDELESQRRGNYCGCSFYLSANNRLDSNILIRSITFHNHTLTCSGGGGIVIDSEQESEYAESAVKVEKILKAISPDQN
ncbi:MAG: aminodeoxychorismate synthase component I [Reinekea sp.]